MYLLTRAVGEVCWDRYQNRIWRPKNSDVSSGQGLLRPVFRKLTPNELIVCFSVDVPPRDARYTACRIIAVFNTSVKLITGRLFTALSSSISRLCCSHETNKSLSSILDVHCFHVRTTITVGHRFFKNASVNCSLTFGWAHVSAIINYGSNNDAFEIC